MQLYLPVLLKNYYNYCLHQQHISAPPRSTQHEQKTIRSILAV